MKIIKIKLLEKIGNSNIGDIYIRGMYEAPKKYKDAGYDDDYFFWEEGIPREENHFFPENCVPREEENKVYIVITKK